MPVLPDFDTLKRADDVPDFETLKPVTRTGTNVPESPPHTEEADAYAPAAATSTTTTDLPEMTQVEVPRTSMERAAQDWQSKVRSGLTGQEGISTAQDKPLFNLVEPLTPEERDTLARDHPKLLGVFESIEQNANALTTPNNLALLAGSMGLGAASQLAGRGIALAFAVAMGKEVPSIARELGTEFAKPEQHRDKTKIAKLITDASIATGFSATAGTHALGKPIADALSSKAEAIKPVAPLTAEAVKEVAQIPEKPTEVPITKEKGPKDAIQEQKSDAGVLRQERSEVGLPQVGARDKGIEETPAAQESKTPTEQKITAEEQSALQKSQRGEDLTVAEEKALKRAESKTPTVTETTPPVSPEDMPTTPTATGFRPAIRLVGGEVVVGDAGKTHPDIIKEHGLKAEEIDQRGFVDEQGRFHDREQTAQTTGVPTQRELGRQHSTDLPESKDPYVAKWYESLPPERRAEYDKRRLSKLEQEATNKSSAHQEEEDAIIGRLSVDPEYSAGAQRVARSPEAISKLDTLISDAQKASEVASNAYDNSKPNTKESDIAFGKMEDAFRTLRRLKDARAAVAVFETKPLPEAISPASPQSVAGKEGVIPSAEAKAGELTKGKKPETLVPAAPDQLLGPLPGDTGNVTKSLEPSTNKSGPTTQLGPDLPGRHSTVSKGFETLDIKVQKQMLSDVLASVHDDKVLDSVIKRIPVSMMNDLRSEQGSPEILLNDKSVLRNALSNNAVPDKPISPAVHSLINFLLSDIKRPATKIGTEPNLSQVLRSISEKLSTASPTGNIHEAKITETAPSTQHDTARVALEKAQADKAKLEAAEMSAKQQQTLPGSEEPQLRGMGAALAGEVDRPESFVSNMFAAIDADRKAMGKEPMPDTQKRSWDEDNTKALNKMNRDPDWIPNLLSEVLKRPRPLLSWENAGLVWHRQKLKAELNNALQRISTAYEGGVEESLTEAKVDAAVFEDKLEELDRAVGRSGTGSEAGRTLQAQKMGAGDDFTLIEMRLQKRAAVGGRPLTDTESSEIQKLHEQITAATKAHETELATKDQRLAEMANKLEVERIAREAIKQPVVPPHIKIVADKIKTYFDNRADAALKRLSGKTFTISPQVLADLTDLGVSRILSGAIEFTEWSVKMAEALGEKVKPHLQTIWEASQSALNDHIVKVAGEGVRSDRVKRAVKGTDIKEQQANVTKTIKDRMDEGKKNAITSLVQKLSRLFVEQGIKERDPLIDAVHGVLKEIDPEFSRRETMDTISGYGDFRQLSKDTISKELRDLKGQMQQVAKLEDMQSGEPPLKTGPERRIPSKEESRLIKLVNDAKRQFQIPISDPSTQLKSSLDTLKKRMQTRMDELNQKIADEDYRPKPKRDIVLDEAAMKTKSDLDRLTKKYREGLLADRLANRPNWEKALDWVTKLRRFDVLSSLRVLPKLLSAGLQRLASEIPEDVAGEIWRHIPGVSKIAEKAPLEGGGVNLRATMRGYGAAVTRGMKDAWEVLKTGRSELDVLYGKAGESYTGESEMGSKILSFPGRVHGFEKAPVKRAGFENAAQRLGEYYAKQGLDPANDIVHAGIMLKAYKAAERLIFLQDNRVSSAFRAALARLESVDPETGKPTVGGKIAATGARFAVPIVRVPVNIAAETMQYAAGLFTGNARLVSALVKGVENVKPEQADLIMRELKKGTVGGALIILGYFNADAIGGYYQPGHKKKEGDLKWGAIRVFGHDIPSYLLHNPLLETLQIGATIRHVADSKLKKKDTETQGLTAGAMAAALGVVEQVPFVREQLELQKLMNPYTRGQAFGEQVKSWTVPAAVQQAAEWTDPEKKRKPTTVLQHIETGIPGLREQVPTAP